MMAWALTVTAALLAAFLVGLLLGRGVFDFWQRTGLSCTAGGMIMAGIPRVMGNPPGWFDLLFLTGLLLFFARTYGGLLGKNLDALDGVADGRLRLPALRIPALQALIARLRRPSPSKEIRP